MRYYDSPYHGAPHPVTHSLQGYAEVHYLYAKAARARYIDGLDECFAERVVTQSNLRGDPDLNAEL